jgi:hypothetical protein
MKQATLVCTVDGGAVVLLDACHTHQGCLQVQAGQVSQAPQVHQAPRVGLTSHSLQVCLVVQVSQPRVVQVGQVHRGGLCLVGQLDLGGLLVRWTQVGLVPH